MALTDDALIAYLKDELQVDIEADGKLFSSGALDSVAMMQLITFIEDKAKIEVRPQDVTLENFDTVPGIVHFVKSQS